METTNNPHPEAREEDVRKALTTREVRDALEALSRLAAPKPQTEEMATLIKQRDGYKEAWEGATETHIKVREMYETQNAELRAIVEGKLPKEAPAGFVRRLLGMSLEDRDYIMSMSATIADLRSQLARKDEGLNEAIDEALASLDATNYSASDNCHNATMVRQAKERLETALHEPDGRKGE